VIPIQLVQRWRLCGEKMGLQFLSVSRRLGYGSISQCANGITPVDTIGFI
jgi:hypothetical protein